MSITVSANLTLKYTSTVGISDPGPNLGTISVTPALAEIFKRKITLTAGSDTSLTALIAGITNYGICYMYNLDPTNYIDWGPDSTGIVTVGRLLPSHIPAVLNLVPGITLRAKAHTGNCDLLICIYGA